MRAWSTFILHVLSLLFLLKLAPCDFTYLYNMCLARFHFLFVCLFVFMWQDFFVFYFRCFSLCNDAILNMRINQPKQVWNIFNSIDVYVHTIIHCFILLRYQVFFRIFWLVSNSTTIYKANDQIWQNCTNRIVWQRKFRV